ncbi:hypothetical protein E2C01_072942 [Portunus trituberculatus]|uniref:Uncharacterized protein n=1 Tax=Portunus trituberculatus TaxID=210409 RepID=A0A5B7IAB6_PORTR|nr:hypothetical protein [Portunus trituberculatus]
MLRPRDDEAHISQGVDRDYRPPLRDHPRESRGAAQGVTPNEIFYRHGSPPLRQKALCGGHHVHVCSENYLCTEDVKLELFNRHW